MNSPRTVRCDALSGGSASKPSSGLSVALHFLRARLPAPLILVAAAVLFQLLPPPVHEALQFDRTALAAGELWRLFTGHVVHFGAEHLAWDAITLLVLAAFTPAQRGCDWAGWCVGSALAISGAVWLLQPHFEFYRGLSGFDCCVFGIALMNLLTVARRTQDPLLAIIAAVAGAAFVSKTGYELFTAKPLFVTAGDFEPVPLAHLTGFLFGIIIALNKRHRLA